MKAFAIIPMLGLALSVAQTIAWDSSGPIEAAPQAWGQITPASRSRATELNESFKSAQAYVYVQPIGAGAGPFPLTGKYKYDALRLTSERIALAGTPLAYLLNAAFAITPLPAL